MLTDQERSQAADILIEAEKTRKPALQLSKTFPNIEVEDSYLVITLPGRLRSAA